MSIKHTGEWHYERIVGRDNGREWRVADEDDDVITDFETEGEAIQYIRSRNWSPHRPDGWKYVEPSKAYDVERLARELCDITDLPPDEPVFILRARDHHALKAIQFYQALVQTEHHTFAIQETIEAFETFAAEHADRMKEPGITKHFALKDRP